MAKGTFQKRLCNALKDRDTLRILKSGEDLLMVVQRDHEKLGSLQRAVQIPCDTATPGGFVRAIEAATDRIDTTIQMMKEAKAHE